MTSTLAIGICGLILTAATIGAIFLGPIYALKIQRELDEERGDKGTAYLLQQSWRYVGLDPKFETLRNRDTCSERRFGWQQPVGVMPAVCRRNDFLRA
jgi:hypothetical protein